MMMFLLLLLMMIAMMMVSNLEDTLTELTWEECR